MFVFRAICAARTATCWEARCGVVTTTASARGSSCPSEMATSPVPGGMSTTSVSSSPQWTSERTARARGGAWPSPHDRRVLVEEETDRHHLEITAHGRDDHRPLAAVHRHRSLVDTEHLRDRIPVHVGVEHAGPMAEAENAAARFAAGDDLPTPPFPLATARLGCPSRPRCPASAR